LLCERRPMEFNPNSEVKVEPGRRSGRGTRVYDPQHIVTAEASGTILTRSRCGALRVTDPRSVRKVSARASTASASISEFGFSSTRKCEVFPTSGRHLQAADRRAAQPPALVLPQGSACPISIPSPNDGDAPCKSASVRSRISPQLNACRPALGGDFSRLNYEIVH
jgi:hypothetical protein